MRILTRQTKQSVMISDHVTVTVLKVRDNQVVFGIDAPNDVSINHKEDFECNLNKSTPKKRTTSQT